MSKTGLTAITALALSLLSVGLIAGRWYILGPEVDGTPGDSTWHVVLEVDGELSARDASLVTVLPPDFRRQHVIDEHFESAVLAHNVRTAKDGGARRAAWKPKTGMTRSQPFRLVYSFRCVAGMRQPTAGMNLRSRSLDAPPRPQGRDLKPAPLIESDHDEVDALAERLAATTDDSDLAQTRAFFEHVADLPDGVATGALACLQEGSGSEAGKARLLAALCRNRKVAARPVSGLILDGDGPKELHSWTEAWVDGHWLPMDPARRLFGAAKFPADHLVLQLGDNPVRAQGVRYNAKYTVVDLHNSRGPDGAPPPSTAKKLWRKMSLTNLRPEEQSWVKFLLLLPVGALAVSIFRTVVGVTTYGTFGPVLLALVCRDPADFPWALGVFVGILLAGWIVRRALDRYHLLMVPRISALLTVIVILLVAVLMLLGPQAAAVHGYVALLPLIILTHMVERFWTVEAEDGTASSFRTLFWTVMVAVAVAVLVNFDLPLNAMMHQLKRAPLVRKDAMRATFFRYPEALGLVLAAQLLIGRYTGYRLTELFRFRDLLLEEPEAAP